MSKKNENQIYMIGNAHLDPVWLWQWYDGYMEVKATFRSALDRMKEFPDFKFTSACAQYYEWIKDSDPAMFDEIKQRVKEGRWTVAGGWYIQPDCNIPCGESFARHALISQRFFKNEMGTMATVGYNVDSFGHNGSIPKMLRNSGMNAYIFMRPGPHEKPNIPDWLFNWESADGSVVPTFRIVERYNIMKGSFSEFDHVKSLATEHSMMAFYGVGNHGGGPTISLLNKMHEELGPEFIYSTPEEFFDAVADSALPLVKEDLQFHAKGCYTACSQIKRDNRRSENMMLAAEKYSVLSGKLMNTKYPTAEYERAWKNILFNQFHDIMGGCSIKEAYDNARMQHGETQSIADRNSNFALQQISWNIDTVYGKNIKVEKPEWGACWFVDEFGTPIVFFNPHAWESTVFVTFRSNPIRVTDADGNELPIQVVRASQTNGEGDKWEVGLNVTLPAMGYTVLRAFYPTGDRTYNSEVENAKNERHTYESKVATTETTIENDLIKLTFDPLTGELAQITDKATGKNMLSAETQTVMMDETDSDTWSHRITEFKNVAEIFTKGDIHVTEVGPLRATMRTYTRGANTTIRRDYSVVAGSKQIHVKTQIDFHEKHRMLKFRFPVDAENPTALCDIPYGFIERPTDGTEQVCQEWFAIKDNKNSLAVLNDSKYSFDCNKNVLSLTVLRGAIYADHFGKRDEFCEYMEQGRNELNYVIMPFESVTETTKAAAELNCAPFSVMETFHNGTLPQTYTAVTSSAANVIITAVKKHEDSDAVVIRAYECENRDTTTEFNVFGQKFKADFGHAQVKTFIVDGKSVREADFLEF